MKQLEEMTSSKLEAYYASLSQDQRDRALDSMERHLKAMRGTSKAESRKLVDADAIVDEAKSTARRLRAIADDMERTIVNAATRYEQAADNFDLAVVRHGPYETRLLAAHLLGDALLALADPQSPEHDTATTGPVLAFAREQTPAAIED